MIDAFLHWIGWRSDPPEEWRPLYKKGDTVWLENRNVSIHPLLERATIVQVVKDRDCYIAVISPKGLQGTLEQVFKGDAETF